MRLYTEIIGNVSDQNYLPNTDKTKDKAFKSDLETVVVQAI